MKLINHLDDRFDGYYLNLKFDLESEILANIFVCEKELIRFHTEDKQTILLKIQELKFNPRELHNLIKACLFQKFHGAAIIDFTPRGHELRMKALPKLEKVAYSMLMLFLLGAFIVIDL